MMQGWLCDGRRCVMSDMEERFGSVSQSVVVFMQTVVIITWAGAITAAVVVHYLVEWVLRRHYGRRR